MATQPDIASTETSSHPYPAWNSAVDADLDVEGHFGRPCRGFYVAVDGLLVFTAAGAAEDTYRVTAGYYGIRVRSVKAAGSSAYGLIFVE